MREFPQLTDVEFDILATIVSFGGYVTVPILSRYTNNTQARSREVLTNLEELKYLRSYPNLTHGKRAKIYQVTIRACKLLERGDSYMRKPHQVSYIDRSLLRAHFLFGIVGQGYDRKHIVDTLKKRLDFLSILGIPSTYFPRKYNGNSYELQVEEYLLTDRPWADDQSIAFLYVDKRHSEPSLQLKTLLNRYARFADLNFSLIVNFVIVVPYEQRMVRYVNAVERLRESNPSLFERKEITFVNSDCLEETCYHSGVSASEKICGDGL